MSIERISALLAKAERTDNEHEAEAYLMKAQAIATATSIDLAMARAATARREARQQPQTRTTTIGEKGRRANQHLIALFIAIAQANDARVDIASNSTFVMSYGMPGDLDVIAAMYSSVAVQMMTAAQGWISLGAWRQESYISVRRISGRSRQSVKPHTAYTARVAFYRGYVDRIRERLEEARSQALASDATSHPPRQGQDRSLVLKAKADEIREFHQATSQARGSWGGYSGSMRGDRGSATKAGRQAASLARLAATRGLPGKSAVEGS